MADVQSNIHVNIDTSSALANLKALQRQISAFHTQMAKSGTAAAAVSANQAQNLMNAINATGKFQASMRTVTTSTEQFTRALEKNKLTSREYFRYTGAATKTFGRFFRSEFETLNKVARERVKDLQTQYVKMGRGANGALQAIAVRPLALDMENLATKTAMAAQRQQLLNQLLKQGSTNLLNFGKNTQWAGRQLMVGFTVPLMLLGSVAAKTFMKLEEQAIRFKRVYGEMFTTEAETNKMLSNIQLLAKEYTKYGVAVEKTMEMAANAAAMGKTGAELLAQVSEATRLAVLGGVEQAQALETTISVTNAFGVAADDLAEKIDFLNAVENQTVVSIEDLTIAIPKAGPVVKQLGGDVEDLAFFLTAMKEGGINASEGANALKSGLASLINPSEKASKMLMGLGVNIRGIVEANKGDVKATVVDFAAALDTLDPLNRARAIEQLFGKFQFSRLSTLFQNVTKEGTQASRVLKLANATSEELAILSERELGRIENSTTYKFKKTIEDLKTTIAPVGEAFLKALTPVVEFVGKILEKFNGLSDGGKKFLTVLTIALGAVGPVALMTFGLLANGIANIIKLFAGLKRGFNRVGSSTQILGQQTDYLTKEQLEAAAVAASLDQVHQRLTQRFTSETTAVNALALAYRNAIAAQIGFTGPVGRAGAMKGVPQSRRYSTGVTSVPGPAGAGDIVPILASPGEAVIPAGPAQDPANKPFIAHMVAGGKIPGFNTGTTSVSFDGKQYNAQSAVGAKNIRDFLNQLITNQDGTLTDTRTGKTFTKARLTEVLDTRQLEGKFSETKIRRSLTRDNMSNKSALVDRLKATARKNNLENITNEQKFLEETLKNRGLPPLTEEQKKNAFGTHASHLTDQLDENGKKIWKASVIAPDSGYMNQFVNTVKGKLGAELLSLSDEKLSSYGIDRSELRKIVAGEHPRTAEAARAFKGAARYQIDNQDRLKVPSDRMYQAHLVDAGTDYRIEKRIGAFAQGGLKSLAEMFPDDRGVRAESFTHSEQEKLKNIAAQAAKTKEGKQKPTNFGRLVTPSPGRSFDVPGVGGVYDGPNGRVFVKPMMSALDALAEQKATQFAREVHGLDTPEQKISTMIDPSDPKGKRKIIVLESKYDPKFANTPTGFTRDEYFKQLTAANLRGDKDLKMGNLGGKVLTDVGTAGVFDRASGVRALSAQMPSMLEMAEKNLKGVPGAQAKNSPNWFANVTKDLIDQKGYTADDYDRDMKKELKEIKTKAEAFVQKMSPKDPLRPAYQNMLGRIDDGLKVDWRALYDKHRSIAIKPNEVVVDEKGKTKKPKTEPMGRTKTANRSKDSRKMSATQASSVRNPVTRIPGKSDADPILNPALQERLAKKIEQRAVNSQALATANSTQMYGTTNPTATQKAIARKNRELAKQGKPLLSLTSQLTTSTTKLNKVMKTLSTGVKKHVTTLTGTAQKQTLAGKLLEKTRAASAARTAKAAKAADGDDSKKGPKGMRPGLGGMAMAAGGIAMVGSMMPGSIGEMSQKLMMPLMGLGMILPMLGSVTGALTVVMLAAVGTMIKLRMEFDKAQDEALKLANVMGSGKDAIRDYAKFAGNVTAGEIMERRSQEKFRMLGPKSGKTTFGESFVQGESGKALIAQTNTRLKSGDQKGAAADLTNQLMTSVLSGAIDAAQAKSIALNIGQKTGNYGLGFAVTANINEIIGPNGENLTKNPLKIRMDLINEKEKQTGELFNQMSAKGVGRGGFMNLGAVNPNVAVGGTTALGAGIGMAIGSAILPGIGTIVGTGLGAIAGAATGYFSGRNENKKAASMSGAVVGSQRAQLEQQQELSDSLDLYYQKKIKELEVEGKIAEAKEMQKDYDDDRLALANKGKAINETILSQYSQTKGNVRSAMDTGVDKMISQRYKGTDEVQYLDAAKVALQDSGLTKEQQYLIKVKMSTGELTPSQQVFLFSNFGDDKKVKEQYMKIVTDFSARTGDEATRVMNMFSNPDGTPNTKLQAEFIGKVSTQANDAEASKYIAFFAEVANTGGVFDMTAALNYYIANPEVAEKTKGIIDNIEKNKGKLTLDVMTNFLPENVMGQIDTDYFNKLSQDERVTYLKEIATIVNIPDPVIEADPDFKKWVEDGALYNNVSYKDKSIGEQIFAYRQFQPYKTTEAAIEQAKTLEGSKNKNGKGPDSSPLDELVKKLRDVRKNQIKVTTGFEASRKVLDNLFGGKKTIDVFSGIENDLRGLGASQDMIELIVGMDPKEYEKQKNKLFKFDNKGNISGLKRDAKNIQEALYSITAGDFKSSMEAETKSIKDQATAFKKLSNLGVPVADAYELISDKALAEMFANSKNSKSIKILIQDYKNLTAAKLKAAAVSGVKKDIDQFKKDRLQEDRISKEYSSLSAAAIKSDENLLAMEQAMADQKAKIEKLIKAGAPNSVIREAYGLLSEMATDFNERLNQLKQTIGFMRDVFDQGYSNAMEAFDVQEKELELQFKIDTKENQKIIDEAQNVIAGIQEEIDDKEAALRDIEKQEEKINEKYDKRIEALDLIEKANQSISEQQKGQLTLAEALTSGDIAAAARAAQEMRAQQAADNITKQKDAMEQARKNELEGVMAYDPITKSYRTREQLEEDIEKLQDKIYEIEEKQIEPAQKMIRLRQIKLDLDIENLAVLGKTRDQWEKIKNEVDLAMIKSAQFLESMQNALKIQSDLIKAYNEQKPSGNDPVVQNPYAPIVTTPTVVDPNAADPSADALKEAADAAAALADAEALLAESEASLALIEAEKILAESEEALKSSGAVILQPSLLASQESGAIGAASIASQYAALALIQDANNLLDSATIISNRRQQYGYIAKGGLVPKFFAEGGFAKGTDTVPAMLTPGEFIMSKYAVDSYGVGTMKAINSGQPVGGTVYNNTYELTVNAKTNANPNEIAQAVISTIKQVDDRRIRGVALSARR